MSAFVPGEEKLQGIDYCENQVGLINPHLNKSTEQPRGLQLHKKVRDTCSWITWACSQEVNRIREELFPPNIVNYLFISFAQFFHFAVYFLLIWKLYCRFEIFFNWKQFCEVCSSVFNFGLLCFYHMFLFQYIQIQIFFSVRILANVLCLRNDCTWKNQKMFRRINETTRIKKHTMSQGQRNKFVELWFFPN